MWEKWFVAMSVVTILSCAIVVATVTIMVWIILNDAGLLPWQ